MRLFAVVILTSGFIVQTSLAKEPHRELGAHEHGRGTLNIAVEGTRVSMEFEVPGADIVGFEHEAKTKQQKAAMSKAKAQLEAPQSLFKMPPAAGCSVIEATVAVESGDHDHEHGKEDAKSSTNMTSDSNASSAHDEHEHSAFHVQYSLECASPGNITAIEFPYFRVFAAAQKVDVNLITGKSQSKYEVTRDKPRIDLAGMI
jgi:hypothetical protein